MIHLLVSCMIHLLVSRMIHDVTPYISLPYAIAPPPLITMPPTAGVNTLAELSFSWDEPPNVEFLQQYIVSYTVTSRLGNARRRRQTMEIFTTDASASIMNPEPYSDYTVNVDGEFQPPGSTEPVRAQVTPETTFLSAQQRKYRELFVCGYNYNYVFIR